MNQFQASDEDQDVVPWAQLLEWAAAALPAYLAHQRWYPAKGAPLTGLDLETHATLSLDSVAAALATWRIKVEGKSPFVLFIPLLIDRAQTTDSVPKSVIGQHPAGAVLRDALADDGFVRALIGWMLEPGTAPAGIVAGSTAKIAALRKPGAGGSISRSKAEQSNSSLRIGDSAMLKVLRRVEPGIHPELEIGRFLTEEAHFPGTPPLLGWVQLGECTVAILQGFIPNAGDGWNWSLEHLRAGTQSDPAVSNWIAILGRRTAEMHAAFRTRTSDDAFRIEATTAADWERWREAIRAMGRRLGESLVAQSGSLDPQAQSLARRVQELLATLDGSLASLLTPLPQWEKSRHHGDFHLGQVLVRGNDAVIVDFEGEPLRPLSERRAKHIALRDVAGMLRSLQYAGATVQREGGSVPGDWSAAASSLYLESYLDRLGALCPQTLEVDTAQRIIKVFMIEKTLYEVLYELSNRPGWICIPLQSLVTQLEELAAP